MDDGGDLKAATEHFDRLVTGQDPWQRAMDMALETHDVMLSARQLDRVMRYYADTLMTLEECVGRVLKTEK